MPTTLALLVAGTFFMENLDGTILATAAPRMARSLGVQSSQIGLCITAYLLSLAVLIPLSAWVADRFGARRTYISAIIVFTTASMVCAASTSLPELVVMRMMQGVGGAMMVPVGRLVVLRSTDKQHMIRAIAYLTWPALLAPIAAPAVGGVITTYASWRWIFLINAPLGVVAVLVALRVMPALQPAPLHRFDGPGFMGSAISLGSIVYLAALLGNPEIAWVWVIVLAAATLTVGPATVRHLRVAAHPVLRLDILSIRTFRAAFVGGSVFRAVMNAVPFLLPLLFQDRFGWSPAKAGAVVLFVFVGNLVVKPLTSPMLQRLGFRRVLLMATFSAMICTAACALLSADTPLLITAAIVMMGGAFRSIGFTDYNTLTFADVDQPTMNQANTLAATVQQFAQGFGVALGVLTLRVGQAFFDGTAAYRFAFVVLASMLPVALLDALLLPRTAGDALRSPR